MFVALQIAMFIVLLELTVGSFVMLYALDVRGDSSRGFILFQGGLYLFFALLTLLAMNAFATPELVSNIVLDSPWLRWQGPLVLIFALLMIPWNVLLWLDPTSSPNARKKPTISDADAAPDTQIAGPQDDLIPRVRLLRFAIGALGSAAGLAALVVVGMAYRTLADSRLGGALVVIALVAGAIALGGIMTAMLLGHWYLNTPTASGRPLEFSTLLTLGALALAFACALLLGPSTLKLRDPGTPISPGTTIINQPGGGIVIITPTPQPTGTTSQQPAPEVRQAPLDTSAFVWLQYLMGFAAPLILGYLAWRLARERSFQSATGMLYLCVAFIFIGEILGRGLLLMPRY